eukprot:COSAG01_NODE_4643_length_4856_cov_13.233971_1_plen_213_part_10
MVLPHLGDSCMSCMYVCMYVCMYLMVCMLYVCLFVCLFVTHRPFLAARPLPLPPGFPPVRPPRPRRLLLAESSKVSPFHSPLSAAPCFFASARSLIFLASLARLASFWRACRAIYEHVWCQDKDIRGGAAHCTHREDSPTHPQAEEVGARCQPRPPPPPPGGAGGGGGATAPRPHPPARGGQPPRGGGPPGGRAGGGGGAALASYTLVALAAV